MEKGTIRLDLRTKLLEKGTIGLDLRTKGLEQRTIELDLETKGLEWRTIELDLGTSGLKQGTIIGSGNQRVGMGNAGPSCGANCVSSCRMISIIFLRVFDVDLFCRVFLENQIIKC